MMTAQRAVGQVPLFLDAPTLKRLLFAYCYGMGEAKIATEFGWTLDELRRHAEHLRCAGKPREVGQ